MAEKLFKNQIRSGNFVLTVLADHVLDCNELLYAVAVYKKANRLKNLPANGSSTIRFPIFDSIE